MILRSLLVAGVAAASMVGMARASEEGESEYMIACAVCHGESGKGDGPFASMMNTSVPGLTGLSTGNDGVFPWLEVFQIVDGRSGVRGHGGPMPIWGDRFSTSARESFGPFGAEVVTRGRIAVLVNYLESIQE